VLVFVAVEVEVEVDVSVEVCVEVSVLVEVVCVHVDVRVARLRDGLGVGPSGGLASCDRLGTVIVREVLGKLLPPAQEPVSRTSIEAIATRYPTAARAWTL
jgi:hypothetical protein